MASAVVMLPVNLAPCWTKQLSSAAAWEVDSRGERSCWDTSPSASGQQCLRVKGREYPLKVWNIIVYFVQKRSPEEEPNTTLWASKDGKSIAASGYEVWPRMKWYVMLEKYNWYVTDASWSSHLFPHLTCITSATSDTGFNWNLQLSYKGQLSCQILSVVVLLVCFIGTLFKHWAEHGKCTGAIERLEKQLEMVVEPNIWSAYLF